MPIPQTDMEQETNNQPQKTIQRHTSIRLFNSALVNLLIFSSQSIAISFDFFWFCGSHIPYYTIIENTVVIFKIYSAMLLFPFVFNSFGWFNNIFIDLVQSFHDCLDAEIKTVSTFSPKSFEGDINVVSYQTKINFITTRIVENKRVLERIASICDWFT